MYLDVMLNELDPIDFTLGENSPNDKVTHTLFPLIFNLTPK